MSDATTEPASPTAHAAHDAVLVRGCLAGEPGAWDRFLTRFGGLFSYVARRTAEQRQVPWTTADGDDAVAEILLECLRDDAAVLRSFAGRSSLSTYLTVVARRVAVRALARSMPRHDGKPWPEARMRHAATADGAAAGTDNRAEVESLLGKLAPDEARLVRLHHLEARSYDEISRLTGMPLNSIGPALSRARQKMRAKG
ncbi:MAG: RNA polymerase sigma factor [Planctomycetia bacterium]